VPFLLVTVSYGVPVLLIRELAVARRLNVAGVVLLGLAYGILNEGVLAKTLTQPDGPPLEAFAGYGRIGELQGGWTVFILFWHALHSVLYPILLCRWMFPAAADRRWFATGRSRWLLYGLILILAGLYALYFLNPLRNDPGTFVLYAATTVALAGIALGVCKSRATRPCAPPATRPLAPALLGGAAILFYVAQFASPTRIPFAVFLAASAATIALAARRDAARAMAPGARARAVRPRRLPDVRLVVRTGARDRGPRCLAGRGSGCDIRRAVRGSRSRRDAAAGRPQRRAREHTRKQHLREQARIVVDIRKFMQGYKDAWEQRDEAKFCALFTADGEYHNTPFAVQRGHAELAEYWRRVKLQEDVRVDYDVLATSAAEGIAHWHVTYQVASEELFRIWARSTGTNLVARKARRSAAPHDPRRRAEGGVRRRALQALPPVVAQHAAAVSTEGESLSEQHPIARLIETPTRRSTPRTSTPSSISTPRMRCS
jgi:hypothetical protein